MPSLNASLLPFVLITYYSYADGYDISACIQLPYVKTVILRNYNLEAGCFQDIWLEMKN